MPKPNVKCISGGSDLETGLITLTVETLDQTIDLIFPIQESWKFIDRIAACFPRTPRGDQIGPDIPVQSFRLIPATANTPIQLVASLSAGSMLRLSIEAQSAEALGRDLLTVADMAKVTPPARKQ